MGGGERPCTDMTLCHQEGRDIDAGSPVLGGTQPSDCGHDPHAAQPLPSWRVRACAELQLPKLSTNNVPSFCSFPCLIIKCVLSVLCTKPCTWCRNAKTNGLVAQTLRSWAYSRSRQRRTPGYLVLGAELHAGDSQRAEPHLADLEE